ncbi:CLUMA_CG021487, isoform A [Clunio marinus]|uniref:CLUMA_CG021487, isoform A n=1 Tax=Clunio marinus TaxID=568069 RepID=A0A1J1JC02_9DIPT|nr:CLUMA_CG021487, isoform A [Clunio marinus]
MKASINNKRFFKAQRERHRMHSLNKALDVLRKKLQQSLSCPELRLPKFEALKLAKNYIRTLELILHGNKITNDELLNILCKNLRPTTANILKKLRIEKQC